MKIADVSEFYSPTGGGVRSYVHQKLEAAAAHGHELTIVAPGGETHMQEVAGGRIAWVKCPQLPLDKNYRMLWSAQPVWRVLDDVAPDMVEGSSPWRGGWIAGNWPGRASKVLFMHADPVTVYLQVCWAMCWGATAPINCSAGSGTTCGASMPASTPPLWRGLAGAAFHQARSRPGHRGADGRRAGHVSSRPPRSPTAPPDVVRLRALAKTRCCLSTMSHTVAAEKRLGLLFEAVKPPPARNGPSPFTSWATA